MTDNAAAAISAAIVMIAASGLLAVGAFAHNDTGDLLVIVGLIVGGFAAAVWLQAVVRLLRSRAGQ